MIINSPRRASTRPTECGVAPATRRPSSLDNGPTRKVSFPSVSREESVGRVKQGLERAGMATAAAAAALLFPLAGIASAAIQGPCDGSATIGGRTYTPANDTPSNPVVLPSGPGLVASWIGSTQVVITNHEGGIAVVIGPGSVGVASWGSENKDKKTSASGEYPVDQARNALPVDLVGLYRVTGFHRGEGGSCTGSAMIKIEGNPLTNPIGAGAAAGTLAAAMAAFAAAFAKSSPPAPGGKL